MPNFTTIAQPLACTHPLYHFKTIPTLSVHKITSIPHLAHHLLKTSRIGHFPYHPKITLPNQSKPWTNLLHIPYMSCANQPNLKNWTDPYTSFVNLAFYHFWTQNAKPVKTSPHAPINTSIHFQMAFETWPYAFLDHTNSPAKDTPWTALFLIIHQKPKHVKFEFQHQNPQPSNHHPNSSHASFAPHPNPQNLLKTSPSPNLHFWTSWYHFIQNTKMPKLEAKSPSLPNPIKTCPIPHSQSI